MILRRVIKHVRNQEWTAVVIDFLIVVLGVFLGIQIGNWNEGRLARIASADFTERLLDDLHAEAIVYDGVQAYHREVRIAAETTYSALSKSLEISDTALLANAFRATQYFWIERYRSTFDELASSGSLSLIEDEQLKSTIAGLYGADLLGDIADEGLDGEYRRAFRMLIPPQLQVALADQCGDRPIEGGDLPSHFFDFMTLSYNCVLDWPTNEVVSAAAILRASSSELMPLLGLRIAELDSRDAQLSENREVFGLESFKQTDNNE